MGLSLSLLWGLDFFLLRYQLYMLPCLLGHWSVCWWTKSFDETNVEVLYLFGNRRGSVIDDGYKIN